MQDDVRQVHILDSINELMDDVLCALREKGIHISDRKYFNYAPVAQAKAWLEGRDTVAPADLIILRHYLWTAPEERAIIQSALVQMCSDPFKTGWMVSLPQRRRATRSLKMTPAQRSRAIGNRSGRKSTVMLLRNAVCR